MAGDHRVGHAQGAVELLVVAAADTAGLDAEEGVVGSEPGQREFLSPQITDPVLHHCLRGSGHGADYLTKGRYAGQQAASSPDER